MWPGSCGGWNFEGATVKAGTQERGTEVIWLHTGNYTRQEARSTVASQQLLRVTAQLSSVGPATYH